MTYKSNLAAHIRPVTRLPAFLLVLQGKLDSRKGESVAISRIAKLTDTCSAKESIECLEAEKKLFEARTKAAQALAAISTSQGALRQMPDEQPATSTYALRENRRRAAKASRLRESAESQRTNLYTIREIITKGNAILEQRIAKTRSKARAKIDAYMRGLHSGKLPSFDPQIQFSDRALSLYREAHDPIDQAVCRYTSYEKESDAA